MKRNQLIWNYYCCVKNSFKSIRIFPIWFYFHWYVYRIIWWKLSEDNSIFSFFISPISLCHNLKCLGKDLLLQDQDSVDNFPRPRRLLASGGRVLLNEIEEMEEILKLKTRMIVLQSKSYWILSNIGKISQKYDRWYRNHFRQLLFLIVRYSPAVVQEFLDTRDSPGVKLIDSLRKCSYVRLKQNLFANTFHISSFYIVLW